MTRAEFERYVAASYKPPKTVAEMRAAGWYSAPCPEDEDVGGCGWQSISIPPDAGPLERHQILAGLVKSAVKLFGEGGS